MNRENLIVKNTFNELILIHSIKKNQQQQKKHQQKGESVVAGLRLCRSPL